MSSRILVTGAGGFVGGRLVDGLLAGAGGSAVVCAAGRTRFPAGCESVEVDILDADAVGALVQRFEPSVVVHLAAQSSIGRAGYTAEATWKTNFVGTLNLASACARYATKSAFLFASSGEVYGASLSSGPVKETSPVRPLNVYARTKLAAEFMLGDVLDVNNKLVLLRAFNHSGAGQDERFVLPSFAKQIARIEGGIQPPVVVAGNIDVARDFLHVSDVVDAYLRLINKVQELPNRSVFNVSSGSAVSLRDMLETLKSLANVEFRVETNPELFRLTDVARAAGDSSLLAEFCDWRPAIPLNDMLSEVLDHARKVGSNADLLG